MCKEAKAARTRERIIAIAREAFSHGSFEAVSLSAIAKNAGVSTSLVIKHFGNKLGLFEATLNFEESAQALFAGRFDNLGVTAVMETLNAPFTAAYSMVRTITISDGSLPATEAIGRRIQQDIFVPLVKRIEQEAPYPDPDPRLRAQAALSLLTGLSLMRRVADIEFFSHDQEKLITLYAQKLQDILDGDPGSA